MKHIDDMARIDRQIRGLSEQFAELRQMWRSVIANRNSNRYYRHKLRLVREDRRRILAECKRLSRLAHAPQRRKLKAREALAMRASA